MGLRSAFSNPSAFPSGKKCFSFSRLLASISLQHRSQKLYSLVLLFYFPIHHSLPNLLSFKSQRADDCASCIPSATAIALESRENLPSILREEKCSCSELLKILAAVLASPNSPAPFFSPTASWGINTLLISDHCTLPPVSSYKGKAHYE